MIKILVILALLVPAAARADAGDRWDGVMVLGQTGAGLGLGVVGCGLIGVTGAALGSAGSSKGDWGAGFAGAVIGCGLGTVAGITAGVKLTGDARGGNGTWTATIGGSVTGVLLTVVSARSYIDEVPPYIAGAFMTITLLAPPIVAYHLSTDENNDVEKRITVPLILGFF